MSDERRTYSEAIEALSAAIAVLDEVPRRALQGVLSDHSTIALRSLTARPPCCRPGGGAAAFHRRQPRRFPVPRPSWGSDHKSAKSNVTVIVRAGGGPTRSPTVDRLV
jgi:hypothetical protein